MNLNIKVLFDNNNETKKDRGWGLGWLINNEILFDTCENYKLLKDGLDFFNTDIKKIRHVVISHDHWDHTGGLMEFLLSHPDKKNLNIYMLPGFSEELKQKVLTSGVTMHLNTFPFQINEYFFLSGQVEGTFNDELIFEQSLIFKEGHRFALITGCAHPGIIRILNHVKNTVADDAEPSLIAGGFHMKDCDAETVEETFRTLMKEECMIAPTHCSGLNCINHFRQNGGKYFLQINRKGEYNLPIC